MWPCQEGTWCHTSSGVSFPREIHPQKPSVGSPAKRRMAGMPVKCSTHRTGPSAALPAPLATHRDAPASDSRSKSHTRWHLWPQAGPGLFNPIKNGLEQNDK